MGFLIPRGYGGGCERAGWAPGPAERRSPAAWAGTGCAGTGAHPAGCDPERRPALAEAAAGGRTYVPALGDRQGRYRAVFFRQHLPEER